MEEERSTFRVEGRQLVDRCGEPVVLRGVNKMAVWRDPDGVPSFAEIARTGANVVRIVWSIETPPAEFYATISNAMAAGLIPMIELHDATGRWDRLQEVVDYWVDASTVAVLQRHEPYLLVNIANEAGTHEVTDEQFVAGYTEAVARMRRAGIRVPLVIDAAGWGRNVEQLLRTAPALQEEDDNLLFSWHAWDTDGDQAARITENLERAVALEIPLLVGEFAHAQVGCKGAIPYRHLMAEAERLGIGWLAWSWGPGNSDCPAMDMTRDGRFETLHGWGEEVALSDPNSIRNTSVRPYSVEHGTCREE